MLLDNVAKNQRVRLSNAVRALGFVRLAERIGQRLAKIRIAREGDAYFVECPYSEAKVAAFRAIPGRKRVTDYGRHGADRFPVTARSTLNQALRRLYPGTIASGPMGLFIL